MIERNLLLTALLALGAARCGPTPSGADGGDASTDGPVSATCEVNPALVREARACRTDDQCPCGAHCELGRCVAQCGPTLGECAAGQSCDRFGYCRAPSAPAYGRPTPSTAVGTLVAEQLVLDAPAAPESALVRIRAVRASLGPVRVTVEAPFEVQCSPMGAFARECEPSELAANATRSLPVRVAQGAAVTPGQRANARFFWGANVESVTLRAPGTPMRVVASNGEYRGSLRLLRAEYTGPEGGTFDLPDSYTTPITVDVFSNTQLALRDPLQTLSEDSALVGTIATTGTDQTVSFTRRHFWRGQSISGAAAGMTATFAPSAMRFNAASGSLTFELTSTIDGLLPAPRGLRLTYRVSVERRGDVRSTMPAAQSDVAMPSMSLARTPWEALSLRALSPLSVPRLDADMLALLATGVEPAPVGPAPAHEATRALDACAADYNPASIPAAQWHTLRDAQWRAPAPWTSMTPMPASSVPSDGNNAILAAIAGSAGTANVSAVSVSTMTVPTTADLPCAIRLGTQDANNCIAGAENYGTVDRCAEFAQRFGCVPTTLAAADERPFSIGASITTHGGTVCVRALVLDANVTRVCVGAAPSPGQCADLLQCARTGGISPSQNVVSSLPARIAAATVSGELACSGAGNAQTASPVDAVRDLGAAGATPTVSQLAADCLQDVSRLSGAPPASVAGMTGAARLAAALNAGLSAGSPKCIDAVRLLGVLGFATEIDRQRAQGSMTAADLRASRRAIRAISRWIDAFGTIANESAERNALPPALRATGAGASLPSARDAMHIAADGWDLLFNPRFASAVAALPGAAIATPDWRLDWVRDANDQSSHTQRAGLLVPLMRLMQVQVELGEELLRDAAFRRDLTGLDYRGPMMRASSGPFGRALRAIAVLHPMVSMLEARGRASAGMTAPSWSDALRRAKLNFAPSLGRMLANGAILLDGQNPIGVEDSDLPLYFFGTERAPSERFSAISTYLLGNGAGSSGWATIALDQLRTAETALTTSVAAQAERRYRAQLDTNAMNARLDEIRSNYGGRIESLCGLPQGLTAARALDDWQSVTGRPFDASQCFVRRDSEECRQVYEQDNRELTVEDVNYQLCVAKLEGAAGYPKRFLSTDLTAIAANPTLMSCSAPTSCPAGTGTPGALCTTCGAVTTEVSWALLQGFDPAGTRTPIDVREQAQRDCHAQFAGGRSSAPSQRSPETDPFANGRCYRGAIGDQLMTFRASATDVLIARSAFQDRLDAYDNAVRSCALQKEGTDAAAELLTKYNAALTTLRVVKTTLDAASVYARGAAECYYMTGAAVGADDLGLAALPVAVGCGLTGVAVFAEIGSLTIGATMETMKDWYERDALALQSLNDFRVCMNDANQHMIGMRTAALQAQRAQQDQLAAAFALRESIESAQRAFAEGQSALADARASNVRAPSFDQWQSGTAREYQAAFARARRFLYLGARAVEYEYQQSSAVRYDVLGASTRAELEAALNALRTTSATGSINGAMPGATRAVLSLRDHLLQIEDRSGVRNAGVHPLTPAERFRSLLREERFVVRDASGAVSGIQLPFALTPVGQDRTGNAAGIALLAGRGCAERIWSINASVQGTPGRVVRGSESTFTEMDVLKRNTFFSQWCTPPSAGPAVQTASVRPSINLFREPESSDASGSGIGGSSLGAMNATQLFTRAQLQPRINVPRAEFEDDRYSNGQTSQLAARGLYGDYALFIPIAAVSRPDGVGGFTVGLDLDQVDDILLRVDYVTVPR